MIVNLMCMQGEKDVSLLFDRDREKKKKKKPKSCFSSVDLSEPIR